MGRYRRQREDGAAGPPLRDGRASTRLGPFAGQPPWAEAAFPERQQKNIGWMSRLAFGRKAALHSLFVATLFSAAAAPAHEQSSVETARDFMIQNVCLDGSQEVL